MKIDEIKELLKTIDKTSLEYVKLESDDIKLEVSKKPFDNKSSELALDENYLEENKIEEVVDIDTKNNNKIDIDNNTHIIKAPLMGTFYSSPSPDDDNFVKVGDVVNIGDKLCILEAMKLMNEINSDVSGEILEVLVENEDLVEYNQPLFKVRPI